ncbi:MAG: hypothetical protein LC657_17660, partial [Desulfobacteraceae bacterium]|nr:hypothetical protein [Desulfobacteraceae bacterium]
KITIDCRLAGRDLVISVSDTGMGLDDTGARAGVGLNNVSRRLENIYGNTARVTLTRNRPAGTIAMIQVSLSDYAPKKTAGTLTEETQTESSLTASSQTVNGMNTDPITAGSIPGIIQKDLP